MVNNLTGLMELGIMMVMGIIIGLIGLKYYKTLNPLNQCWYQYYILLFSYLLMCYFYWRKDRECKDK